MLDFQVKEGKGGIPGSSLTGEGGSLFVVKGRYLELLFFKKKKRVKEAKGKR